MGNTFIYNYNYDKDIFILIQILCKQIVKKKNTKILKEASNIPLHFK